MKYLLYKSYIWSVLFITTALIMELSAKDISKVKSMTVVRVKIDTNTNEKKFLGMYRLEYDTSQKVSKEFFISSNIQRSDIIYYPDEIPSTVQQGIDTFNLQNKKITSSIPIYFRYIDSSGNSQKAYWGIRETYWDKWLCEGENMYKIYNLNAELCECGFNYFESIKYISNFYYEYY